MSTICDDLRTAILQAAIQGKLTKQLPKDGDAEELLAEIESKSKTTNKKIKPISSKEKPFEIPNNWKWERFGKIVDFNMGKTPPRAEASYWGNDISWVSIADMPENDVLLKTKEKISSKAFKDRFNSKICPKGTLIMSFKLTVGRCSILGIDAVHNEAIISINPIVDSGFTFRDYLARVLPFLSNYGETKDAIKGRTLNSDSLNNLLIPVPPLAEQKRIVEKVDELMTCVASLEQSADALASLKKAFSNDIKASLLQAAMQGKLTKQLPEDGNAEDLLEKIKAEKEKLIAEGKIKKQNPLALITDGEIPFSIPENWKWVRLNDILDVRDGTHDSPKYVKADVGVPLVTSKNLRNGSIDCSDVKYISIADSEAIDQRSKVDINDIVMAMIGTIGNPVKVVERPHYSIKNMALLKHLPENMPNMDYILQVLNWAVSDMKEKSSGGVQKFASLNFIRGYPIPFPPLAEQKRISERLDTLIQNINVVEDLIASE